jgi:YVTN family beta-propeller protein
MPPITKYTRGVIMRKKLKLKKVIFAGMWCILLAAGLLLLSGCPGAPGTTHTVMLYLFSTFSSNVFSFNVENNTCSTDPIFSYRPDTGDTDAGDHVYFYNDRGYIAAGSLVNPSLLTFNPNTSTITPSVFTHTWKGGPSNIIFINATKAYVTDTGSYDPDTFEPMNDGGVFIFNPSYTETSLTKITNSDANSDGMVYIANKNKAYVTNSGSDTVSVIDTTNDTETKEIAVDDNPTAIVALSDGSKVYAFCTNYVGNSTLKEIDTGTDTVTDTFTITQGAGTPAGLPSIIGTKIYYTGLDDFWAGTGPFFIDVSEGTPAEEMIDTAVAGGSTLIYDNRLYVTNPSATQSTLTVVDLADNKEIEGSPFDVGGDGDGIKGMAVY